MTDMGTSSGPPPLPASAVHRVLDGLLTTCAVVTASDGARSHGCLVASLMPVGLRPTLVAVGLTAPSLLAELVQFGGAFAVHLLDREDHDTAARFGARRSGGSSRLDGVSWRRGVTGAPVLDGLAEHLEARVVGTVEVRRSLIVLGMPVAGGARSHGCSPYTIVTARETGLEEPRVSTY